MIEEILCNFHFLRPLLFPNSIPTGTRGLSKGLYQDSHQSLGHTISKNKITELDAHWLTQLTHSFIFLFYYVRHIVGWVCWNCRQWNRRYVLEPWSRNYGLSYRCLFIVVSFKMHPFHLETDDRFLYDEIEYKSDVFNFSRTRNVDSNDERVWSIDGISDASWWVWWRYYYVV